MLVSKQFSTFVSDSHLSLLLLVVVLLLLSVVRSMVEQAETNGGE